jgi:UDP-2,3-diacylglucosamine hydrolase
MATLLISDLHLDEARPQMLAAFERLLLGPARGVERLYILGDLFEAWVGDDDDSSLATRVAGALAQLTASGVDCAFQHGNRDFLVGAEYAARCGMRLLDEQVVEVIEGVSTLLLHGDTLCTGDTGYLAFRAQVRTPQWRRQFLAQGLAARRTFAAAARAQSAEHTGSTAPILMDVTREAVDAALRTHGVRRMIHGHTHRPAMHAFDLDGDDALRVVLGDWYGTASGLLLDGGSLTVMQGN